MTPLELVRAVSPQVGALGSAFYFDPATLARGKELGLDGFRFYFLGRGGVLGDVEARVVQSAFGYFAPSLVDKIWNSARQRMPPREAGRAYLECARELGRRRLAAIPGLDEFCAAARTVNEAAEVAGLSLYAGLSAEPLCDDLPGQAMQLSAVLREHRGSAHLLAVRASGLDPAVAHAIKRPGDVESFGWSETPEITADDRDRHAAAEQLTDRMVLGAYASLDEPGGKALVAGLESIEAALAA
jgi:hypothetical protein